MNTEKPKVAKECSDTLNWKSEVKCKRTFSLLDKVSEEATNLWHDICRRENMSEQARQLIDSKGCQRIIQKLLIGLKTEQEQQ